MPFQVAEAESLVGSVLPVAKAGFGGAYGLILSRAPATQYNARMGGDLRLDPTRAVCWGACRFKPHASGDSANRFNRRWSMLGVVVGGPGQVFRVVAGDPRRQLQDLLAAEAPRTARGAPVSRQTWSWRATTLGRAKPCEAGRYYFITATGVSARPCAGRLLVNHCPTQIDDRFPRLLAAAADRAGETGTLGGWALRGFLRLHSVSPRPQRRSCSTRHNWCIDRRVLVYAPPLCEWVGPHLGPSPPFPPITAEPLSRATEAASRSDRAQLVRAAFVSFRTVG